MLVTAFAAVPGSSPHGAALLAIAAAVRGDVDLVTVKTELLSHVERIGDARMFRVPVGEAGALEQRVTFDRAVARQLEAEPYDVVHVRGPFEGAIAADRKHAFGFQLVYEMATFPDEALGAEVERRWSEAHAKSIEHADLVLVPTEAARRAVLESVPAERVVVLPPGIDVGSFDWRPASHESVPRLLYLGSFTADRDLATVLGALRRVVQTRPVRALVAGETDRHRREQMRAMVDAFQLGGVVEVRGEPPPRTLPKIIAGADLCLAPASEAPRFQSLGDLPQPLLEYLACHRPVIAAGVPGVSDALRDEQDGLLYPPGDEGALADAILEMLRDESLRDRTTESGYRRVRELFSSGARRRRIAEIYERLAPGSQDADPWDESFEDGETGALQVASISSLVTPDTGDRDHAVHEEIGADSEEPTTHNALVITDSQSAIELDTSEVLVVKTQPGEEITRDIPAHLDTDPGLLPIDTIAPEATRRTTDTDPG
ncbi:Glycosyltransferase [Sandaracinus amylolyticus]|uniref:Glycosyltransferase n=1 Tax=Sandaracinus amylolyticus TaxID=927083 RepID=A0A0F6SF82_9BACT|nr:Glycosyltransferase [Sandaracinus amylolyticus]